MAAPSSEMHHAAAALARFRAMFASDHLPDGVARQAEQDRLHHAATYAPELVGPAIMDCYAPMLCMRFMVEICGITYEAAEKAMIADLAARNDDGSYRFAPINNATADALAGDFVREMGAVEAVFQARLYNEAAKGSPWASYWNEVVRIIRTSRFAPLDSGLDSWN